MKYYIASKLENFENVQTLKTVLDKWGWHHTYDWTVHGSVQRSGTDVIREVAVQETVGVDEADVVIVLLPGGRGTHVELGIAIGTPGRSVYVVAANVENDFGDNGNTCAFYHHPRVIQVKSMMDLIGLLGCHGTRRK